MVSPFFFWFVALFDCSFIAFVIVIHHIAYQSLKSLIPSLVKLVAVESSPLTSTLQLHANLSCVLCTHCEHL